jgi:hypothetical protein
MFEKFEKSLEMRMLSPQLIDELKIGLSNFQT